MIIITIQDFSAHAGQHDYTTLCLFLLGGDLTLIKQQGVPVNDHLWKTYTDKKPMRIIHTLCRLRTTVMLHAEEISSSIGRKHNPWKCEAIAPTVLKQLEKDNVNYRAWSAKSTAKLLRAVNVELGSRLGNCEAVTASEYRDLIKSLISMPNGRMDSGAAAWLKKSLKYPAKNLGIGYFNIKTNYTVQMWTDDNALLSCLSGTATLLDNKDRDQSRSVKNLNSFLERDGVNRVCVYVDCENADPFRFCAAMNNISKHLRSKISKIVLIRDGHSSAAWSSLEQYVTFPVEEVHVTRVLPEKSLTDATLIAEVTKAHCQNKYMHFIICSSDSDMICVARSMPNAKFLYLLERAKCSAKFRNVLSNSAAAYCMIDDVVSPRASYYYAASVINSVGGFAVPLKEHLHASMKRLYMSPEERYENNLLLILLANSSVVMNGKNDIRLRIGKEAHPAIAKLWAQGGELKGTRNNAKQK